MTFRQSLLAILLVLSSWLCIYVAASSFEVNIEKCRKNNLASYGVKFPEDELEWPDRPNMNKEDYKKLLGRISRDMQDRMRRQCANELASNLTVRDITYLPSKIAQYNITYSGLNPPSMATLFSITIAHLLYMTFKIINKGAQHHTILHAAQTATVGNSAETENYSESKEISVISKKDDRGSNLIIILVHGTFATGAPWTRPGSAFHDSLICNFGRGLLIKQFDWTGNNSVFDRQDAATSLASLVDDLADKFPDRKQILIAHSHGGNILLHASNLISSDDKVAGIVCISTPFLHAHLRDLSFAKEGRIVRSFAGILLIPLLASNLFYGFDLTVNALAITTITIASTFFAAFIAGAMEPTRDLARVLVNTINFDLDNDIPLLVIRKVGDEAAPALGANQLISWITTKIFYRLSVNDAKIEGRIFSRRPLPRLLSKFWIYSLAVAMGYIITAAALSYAGVPLTYLKAGTYLSLMLISIATLWTLFLKIGIFTQILFGSFLFALLAIMTVSGYAVGLNLPADVNAKRLSVRSWLMSVFLALQIEICAEASPSECAEVVQLRKSARDMTAENESLVHSAYEDDRVVSHINDWIAVVLRKSTV